MVWRAIISSVYWLGTRHRRSLPMFSSSLTLFGPDAAGQRISASRCCQAPTSAETRTRIPIIAVPGLPDFPFRPDETRKSGVGISVWAGGQYHYPLTERVRLLLGSNASLQQYPGKEFDQMSLSGHVGPSWLAGRNTEVSLLTNVRKNWVGASLYSSDIGAKLQVVQRLTQRINFTGQVYWQRSKYRTQKFLDGPLRNFSLYGNWLITPTVRAEAGAGYARQRPEGSVVPQHQPLGADRRLGCPSTRLHLGCQIRIAPKTIQRRQCICYAGRIIAKGSYSYPARLSLQSRIHSVRLQSTTHDYQRGTKIQRTIP